MTPFEYLTMQPLGEPHGRVHRIFDLEQDDDLMDSQICRRCNKDKPMSEYYARKRPVGSVYYKTCKECTIAERAVTKERLRCKKKLAMLEKQSAPLTKK